MNNEQHSTDISNGINTARVIKAERARLAQGRAERLEYAVKASLEIQANTTRIAERNTLARRHGLESDGMNLVELLALYS